MHNESLGCFDESLGCFDIYGANGVPPPTAYLFLLMLPQAATRALSTTLVPQQLLKVSRYLVVWLVMLTEISIPAYFSTLCAEAYTAPV
jgi:hypothetical protein